jgi:hypothetical protein
MNKQWRRREKKMKMHLWLLTGNFDHYTHDRDVVTEIILRAKSEPRAREIAAANHCDEGPDIWTDATKSTCELLKTTGDEAVILRTLL